MTDPFPIQRDVSYAGSWIWWGSLALFCLAVATGGLFRFSVAYGGVESLTLGNIRHAHSHLMYMGWATPALMGLIWMLLPSEGTRQYDRLFRLVVGTTFAAAVLCYPLFLLYGYTPVQMGPIHMPVAAAASGLNILCWYAFVGLYVAGTRRLARTGPVPIWDVALVLLTISTLGAWGVGVLHGFDLYDPIWTTAAIHFYLDFFSEGWFVLGVLGVMVGVLGEEERRSWKWPLIFVTGGVFGTFLLALPSTYLPAVIQVVGRVGAGLVGFGLLLFVGCLYRRVGAESYAWIWGLPLAALGLKGAGQLTVAFLPVLWPGDHSGLRILYLHLMLLGFVSTGLTAGARVVWQGVSVWGLRAFYGSVVLLLGSLVILAGSGGESAQKVAMWAGLLPLFAATGVFVQGMTRAREPSGTSLRT